MTSVAIAEFLILDRRLPRSLAFCTAEMVSNLKFLAEDYGQRMPCHDLADVLRAQLKDRDINSIFEFGLHQFISDFIRDNNALGMQIEEDYRFYK